MSIELVPLGTMRFTLATPIVLADTPRGTRVIVEVSDGTLVGDRITAHQKGAAAADWLTVDAQGLGTLDVRGVLETDDGALIYVSYTGRFDTVGGTGPVTAPLFDTGDERYRWLAKIQAVAKGTIDGQTLTYEVYEVR
jgi:hypothetical protein